MPTLMKTHGPALDEAGLELPFASLHGDRSRPAAPETFDPESSDRWDGEELAWLDLEHSAFEVESSLLEAPWLESPLGEARWREPEANAHGEHAHAFAPAFELESEPTHGYGLPYAAVPEGEGAERSLLEALLESEAGPGTPLADRIRGVAEFVMGPTLRRGSSGVGVATLQRALAALGHDVAVDGSFGPSTERALRAFQAREGLEADGVAGPRTKGAIGAALAGRAPGPQPQPAPKPSPPLPSPPPPPPPRPDEDVDAFASRLGTEWSRRESGKRAPELIRDRLRDDYQDTLQGARLRWGSKVTEDDIRRAWMISREEEMRFQTERHASVKPLGAFQPPATRVELVSDRSIGGSDVAPVAPIMVRFVAELRRRFPGASAANYRGHGGGSFNNRGYSLDLYIPGRDARGFYPQASAIQFLRAVDGAAKALRAQWRMIYNDFAVADAINRETGRNNVIFVGSVRRDKGNRVAGLNWHGPHPLILHFHLDLAPSVDSPQGEMEHALGQGYECEQDHEHGYECEHAHGHAWRGERHDGESAWLREGGSAQHAFESYLEHEQDGPGILDRVKSVAALAFGPALRQGSSGAAVKALQRCLVAMGASIGVDGAFGPATDRAVREFQARSGLQADGVVGALTKAALAAALGGAAPGPAPAPPSGAKGRIAGFIARYGAAARTSQQAHGIPALFVLAQAALESGWGDRAPGFNLFGVKSSASAPAAERQLLLTTEHHRDPNRKYPEIISITPMSNGWYEYKVRDWFRVYPDALESFAHHAHVLKHPRYAAAFSHMHDPYAFAAEIVRGGYATGRDYLNVLTKVMRSIEAAGGP